MTCAPNRARIEWNSESSWFSATVKAQQLVPTAPGRPRPGCLPFLLEAGYSARDALDHADLGDDLLTPNASS
jgi:hypothetical protein